jgi:small multidrug resistance family-3 protein
MQIRAGGSGFARHVYIVAAIFWLLLAEGMMPDRWDVIGALICIADAAVILFGPRSSA